MFAAFLSRALTLLSLEVPWVYRALCDALGRRDTRITVDNDAVTVRCDGQAVGVLQGLGTPVVQCIATRSAILSVIDARMTLVEAIECDALWLAGDVEDLLAFHEGLIMFVHGAVRCSSFPELLRSYRALERNGGDS